MADFRFLWLFLFLCRLVSAAEGEEQAIEVMAKSVEATQTALYATEGVVVSYQGGVIRADSARYEKEIHRLVLDGHVEMIGYKGTKEQASHVEIDTVNRSVSFQELFFASANDLWLLADEANRTEGNYTFGNTMLSSCEVEDPLWKMFFSQSTYDSQAHYMKIHDATVYFQDVPVFYLPYLAFSTNNERSSGLLFPLFGYSRNEGLIYEQPVFWAISDSMDLEFSPQIRTKRSLGAYATYRFADSPYSYGTLRAGYFRDKASYARKYNLPEDQHYGFELLYDSSRVFSGSLPKTYTDGLYANITVLNDIDYLNLQKKSLSHFGQVPLQESRVNYFLYNDAWYGGLNAKYFIDTRLKHNDTTLQTLYFGNDASLVHDYFQYNSNVHNARLYSDLTKHYNGFVHVLQPSVHYTKPGNESEKPVSFEEVVKDAEGNIRPDLTELFSVGLPEEELHFSLNQYLYDESMHLVFFQRLSQSYFPDRDDEMGELRNEMQYNWNHWQFYSNLHYSFAFGKVSEASTRISLQEEVYNFNIGHTYKVQLEEKGEPVTSNDLNFDFSYNYNEHITRIQRGLLERYGTASCRCASPPDTDFRRECLY